MTMTTAGDVLVRIGLHVAVLCAPLLALAVFGQNLPAVMQGSAETPQGGVTTQGRLAIQGRAIERLTLVDANDKVTAIERPQESILLPAGKYRVQQVELQGGFSCHEYFASDDAWLHVAAGRTPVLKVGAPLTPQVNVKRTGRVVTIDYELVDAAGRTYSPGNDNRRTKPPTFAVFKNGQTIGSGSFEYG